jgi:hypothetical protein
MDQWKVIRAVARMTAAGHPQVVAVEPMVRAEMVPTPAAGMKTR